MGELVKCRSCHKPMRLMPTENGRRTPVESQPAGRSSGLRREFFDPEAPAPQFVILGDGRVHVLRPDEPWDGDLYVSHFATCREARRWNRKSLRRAADQARARVFEGLHDDLEE